MEEIKIIQERIGKELLKLRTIDNDYSIDYVAEISTLNKDTIYRYERGQGNNFDTLASILKVYGLNFKIFFDNLYDNMQNKEE